MKPWDVIKNLAADNSRLTKEAVLEKALESGCEEFFAGAKLAYDNMITFGVKKLDKGDHQTKNKLTWDVFFDVIERLRKRDLTGNDAREEVARIQRLASEEAWEYWYKRVLLKNLDCGVTETTINKVVSKMDRNDLTLSLFSCQLAQDGTDQPKHMTGEKFLDAKLDGVRILTVIDKETKTVTQYTRNGKINTNFKAITSMLEKNIGMFKESLVLDGEMVSKNFNTLMRQVNRKENVDTDDARLALFDIISLAEFKAGESTTTQTKRNDELERYADKLSEVTDGRVTVLHKTLVNLDTPEGQKTFKEFNRKVLNLGLEGIMVKNPKAIYECKRSRNWLKIKPVMSVDLEVIEFEEGTGKFAGSLGAIIAEGTDSGKHIKVNVGSGFSNEEREEIWKNRKKYKGLTIEIEADHISQDRDGNYSLRFPRFKTFRGFTKGDKI